MGAKQTWRRKSNLAEWNYNIGEVSSVDPEEIFLDEPAWRCQWVARKIEFLLDTLKDFAWIDSVGVRSIGEDEDGWVVDEWQPQESRSQLLDLLRKSNDITSIELILSLECVAPGKTKKQRELWIESGASILVFLDSEEPPQWSFTLYLNADIYAPLSWGEIRNNAQLAKLNQPRLEAFLLRLEEELDAKFVSVSAPDYPNMVGQYGFFPLPEG